MKKHTKSLLPKKVTPFKPLLCCVLSPRLSCASCGIIVCDNCTGWRYHSPEVFSKKLAEYTHYICPVTKETVAVDYSRLYGLKLERV